MRKIMSTGANAARDERGAEMVGWARVAVWPVLIVALGTAGTLVTWSPMLRTSIGIGASAEAVGAATTDASQTALEAMDRALAARDTSGAEMAWRNAYGLAVRSRRWQALLAAGEGSLRIGNGLVVKQPYQARAREAWWASLFLARAQHSVDGVLKVADAFEGLGDTDVVVQVLHIAESLAVADSSGETRKRVLEAQLRRRFLTTQRSRSIER